MPDITNYDGRLEQMAYYCEAMLDNIAKVNNAYHDTVEDEYKALLPDALIKWKGIKKIGGKTIIMNQKCFNGDFSSLSPFYWNAYVSGTTISVADNVATMDIGTATPPAILLMTNGHETFFANHKFYCSADFMPNITENMFVSITGARPGNYAIYGECTANVWTHLDGIVYDGSNRSLLYVGANTNSVTQFKVKNIKMIDLTLAFGSGNEPTLEQCRTMFPADYYEFDEGTLLSAGVTEVVSKGKNLADYTNPDNLFVATSTTNRTKTPSTGGQVLINGANVTLIRTVQSYGLSIVLGTLTANTAYTLSVIPTNIDGYAYIEKVNGSVSDNFTVTRKFSLRFVNNTVTFIPNEDGIYEILLWSNNTNSISVENLRLESGSTVFTNTYPIPAEVQAITGYGFSCPSHYNYIDFEAKKYVQEVGSRAYASGDESDSTVITDGTNTNYELDTPLEFDISDSLPDMEIDVVASGSVTFENQHGDDYRIPVPVELEYIGV